jgi:hypothetical protein
MTGCSKNGRRITTGVVCNPDATPACNKGRTRWPPKTLIDIGISEANAEFYTTVHSVHQDRSARLGGHPKTATLK